MRTCKICGKEIKEGELVEVRDGDIVIMYHRKCLKGLLKKHFEPLGFKIMEEIPND